MKKVIFTWVGFFMLEFFLAGCGPTYVVVRSKPIPPHYVRPHAPGPGYVWIEGEWTWGGTRYLYHPGYWAVPKHRFHRYIPGHWQQRRDGWIWVRGHWN
ncbi:MAG: YXWGXW repeat-containing protein [Bacteroidota bacterium]|nr:YXWGXW repeat-containing protein [Bacteroidota bacterium]